MRLFSKGPVVFSFSLIQRYADRLRVWEKEKLRKATDITWHYGSIKGTHELVCNFLYSLKISRLFLFNVILVQYSTTSTKFKCQAHMCTLSTVQFFWALNEVSFATYCHHHVQIPSLYFWDNSISNALLISGCWTRKLLPWTGLSHEVICWVVVKSLKMIFFPGTKDCCC